MLQVSIINEKNHHYSYKVATFVKASSFDYDEKEPSLFILHTKCYVQSLKDDTSDLSSQLNLGSYFLFYYNILKGQRYIRHIFRNKSTCIIS